MPSSDDIVPILLCEINRIKRKEETIKTKEKKKQKQNQYR